MSIIKQFANYKNICTSKKKIFSQNVGYKVFEINDLVNFLINMAVVNLKNKFKPPKKYNIENEFIQEYSKEQIYLNPYFQVFEIIKQCKKHISQLNLYDIYENKLKKDYTFHEHYYENYLKNKYEQALLKIYPYRNSIYFDEFTIDESIINVTNLDPSSLEKIFNLIPDFKIKDNIENKEYNMDLEHPYYQTFCYNTKKFYIYLMEYQMIIQNDVLDLCRDYLYNYIIDYIHKKKQKINTYVNTEDVNTDVNTNDNINNKKIKSITYYLNNFDNDWNIVYCKNIRKNRITFMKDMLNEYMKKTRAEYKFPYEIVFGNIEKKPTITIGDICEYVRNKYGCVLNFGHESCFEIPYMDFIDDYKIFLKDNSNNS